MTIWTPENTPPQVSSPALELVRDRAREEGVLPLARMALDQFGDAEPVLLDRLDILSFEMRDKHSIGLPQRVMRLGASLTWLAYHETGYDQRTDDEIHAMCSVLAEFEGVPEAYYQSLWQDQQLKQLLDGLKNEPSFPTTDDDAYQHLFDVGAGYVRYHLEAAVKAA